MNARLDALTKADPKFEALKTELSPLGASPSLVKSVAAGTNLTWIENLEGDLRKALEKIGAKSDTIDEQFKLLKSTRPEVRAKAMENILGCVYDAFAKGNASDYEKVVQACVEKIGLRGLRLQPAVERLFQRYVQKIRRRGGIVEKDFEKWLRQGARRGKRLRQVLEELLQSDMLTKLRNADHIHVPVHANITIGAPKVDAIMDLVRPLFGTKEMPGLMREKLLKKLGGLLEAGGRTVDELVKNGKLLTTFSFDEIKVFLRADLSLLQGNLGEVLALARQAERYEKIVGKTTTKAIYLATDVRLTGTRHIVEKEAARAAAAAGDTSVLAKEKLLKEVEFSDDLIVDFSDSSGVRILEQHETKVTRDSIADGLEQIDKNVENLAMAEEISFGRLYKLEDGKLTLVGADELGKIKALKSNASGRMAVSESKDYIKSAARREAELDAKLGELDKLGKTDDLAEIDRRRKARGDLISAYASDEIKRRELVNLRGSQKVLFAPANHLKAVPEHIELVSLGYAYEEIIDFCNLLLIQGGFRRLM